MEVMGFEQVPAIEANIAACAVPFISIIKICTIPFFKRLANFTPLVRLSFSLVCIDLRHLNGRKRVLWY